MKSYNTNHLIVIVVACFIGCKSPTPDPDVSTTTSVLSENNLEKVREKCASMESMYSLLVAKDGEIVIEDYLHGKTAEDLIHVRSLSKGVLSILAGITIDKNLMSEDDFVSKFFTEENLHLADKVKISHLLNMTSGIEWDEDKEIGGFVGNLIQDPAKQALSKELTSTPGTEFNYSTLGSQVLSECITRAWGEPLDSISNRELFSPLGIEDYEWLFTPSEQAMGGISLQLKPRDLMKIGILLNNSGIWNSNRVVPQEWINKIQTSQIDVKELKSGYSNFWWVSNYTEDKIYSAQGYGGQCLILVPSIDLVVLTLQSFQVSNDQHQQQSGDVLNSIFPLIYSHYSR